MILFGTLIRYFDSDSLSVLRSLKNLDHRNPLIQQMFRKYNYLSSFKEIVFCWLQSHTNIRGNELADLEAKSALSLSINNLKIPHSDFKSNIHQHVMKCQSVWEEQTGCWLVVLGLNDPLRQYFSLYRVVSQREGERGEKG